MVHPVTAEWSRLVGSRNLQIRIGNIYALSLGSSADICLSGIASGDDLSDLVNFAGLIKILHLHDPRRVRLVAIEGISESALVGHNRSDLKESLSARHQL